MTAWNGLKRTGFKKDRDRLAVVQWLFDNQTWREHGKGRNWPLNYMPESTTSERYPVTFQAHVEKIAHDLGWKTSHAHLPFFDTAGIPDLYLLRVKGTRRHLWAELKVRDRQGKWRPPTGAQADWIADMRLAGEDVRLWLWPDSDDEIYEELAK
jgi:hypothetical protein